MRMHLPNIAASCAKRSAVEVDTQGDAFFVAFPMAVGALDAAGEALAALAPGPIRVRIGIHTGTGHVTQEGYVGQDVHKGARIAAGGSRRSGAALEGDVRSRSGPRHRPWRTSPEGLRRTGLDLPARRGTLPAPEDDLEHEPAPAGELVRGPGARARGAARLAPGRRSHADADRARRVGQDEAGDRGRRRA